MELRNGGGRRWRKKEQERRWRQKDVLPMTTEVGCKFVTMMSDDIASEEMSTTSVPGTERRDSRKEKPMPLRRQARGGMSAHTLVIIRL
ncbi:hypothetical protein HNY73_002284 [Argiope bruennichi]|uniref:Uncharacterized protein n=1 Tax=Argiope bruennichi TaxID=94029 RepID=A0A8T0FT64_ARGBR|nr:hypothetical protein HNY73_002284 [Argiope bruennichi]